MLEDSGNLLPKDQKDQNLPGDETPHSWCNVLYVHTQKTSLILDAKKNSSIVNLTYSIILHPSHWTLPHPKIPKPSSCGHLRWRSLCSVETRSPRVPSSAGPHGLSWNPEDDPLVIKRGWKIPSKLWVLTGKSSISWGFPLPSPLVN